MAHLSTGIGASGVQKVDFSHSERRKRPILPFEALGKNGLNATNSQDQDGWGRRIGIAERILDEREIPRH